MATNASIVSVDEYLRTSYKPACEYIDGVLHQKPMPTRKHGLIQARLAHLITMSFRNFEAASEVTVQIRTGRYLVPDLVVQRCDRIQDPYPSEPVHLCVEILSPDDRMSEIFAKCEEYHAWGVETAWVVDPEGQRAWEYRNGRRPAEVSGSGSLDADGISISLPELFSVLWS